MMMIYKIEVKQPNIGNLWKIDETYQISENRQADINP